MSRVGAAALAVVVAAVAIPLAWNQWSELAARRARSSIAESHARAGDAARARGDHRRAVVAFQEAWTLEPSDAKRRSALVRARAELVARDPEALTGRTVELAHELELALDDGAADPALYALALGNIAQAGGDADGAIRWYERAIELDPKLAAAHLRKGVSLLASGRPVEAEVPLREAIRLDAGSARAHAALGAALKAQDKAEAAAEALAKAVELERSFDNLRALGALEVQLERFGKAATTLEAAREKAKTPDEAARAGVSGDLGFAYYKLERNREAMEALQAAVRADPSEANLYNLGVVHQALEDHADAVPVFEEMARRFPMVADAHVRLVVSLVKSGQTNGARAAAQRFLNLAARDTRLAEKAMQVRGLIQQVDAVERGVTSTTAPPTR